MAAKNAQINVEALNAAVKNAMPKHMAEAEGKEPSAAKSNALNAFPGAAKGFAGLGAIEDAATTFCGLWPKAYAGIKVVLKFGGWFMSASQVAAIKAVLDAINTEIVPTICKDK